MFLSKSTLWAVLIGFLVLTAGAVIIVNRTVTWSGPGPISTETIPAEPNILPHF